MTYGLVIYLRTAAISLLASLPLIPAVAFAHDTRPVVIDFLQDENFHVDVKVKVPNVVDYFAHPTAHLPDSCKKTVEPPARFAPDAYVIQGSYQCDGSLSGESIGIDYPSLNPSLSSLLNIEFSNGEIFTRLLAPNEDRWVVPSEASFATVARDYTKFGITHIWSGLDHLLFITCLLFIARSRWRVIAAITGFTLAHSLTLALSVLGTVRFSVSAIEAVIALSIVFLATEIARGDRGTLSWRRPIVVASIFGLLHGLGFASALVEIGLPEPHRILALVFFNLGVELGQILFIAAVLSAVALIRATAPYLAQSRVQAVALLCAVYAIGITASYWFFERSLSGMV